MMRTRTCTKCSDEKPYSDFHVRAPKKGAGWIGVDGQYRSSECRACAASRAATWREQHATPEWYRKNLVKKHETMIRVKDAVFCAYGGYECACCGETERKFLTLDHIASDGASWRRQTFGVRTSAGGRTYAWLAKHGFPKGYQVLCMNCNFGKRMNNGVCPHQQVRRNDHPLVGVGPSGPKRTAPALKLVGEEMVSSAVKAAAVSA